MNKIFYPLFFSLIFFACEPREITGSDESTPPVGELIFSPKWSEGEAVDNYTVTAISPSLNSYTIAATTAGNMLRQKIEGYGWTIYDIVENPITILHRADGKIYGASSSGEFYVSETNGRTWDLTSHLKTDVYSVITATDNSVLAGTASGLFISNDYGETWRKINNGIETNSRVFSLILLNDESILAGTEKGLYKSEDNGESWIYTGFNEICTIFSYSYASDLFAGTFNGVYKSEDMGNTWVKSGLNGRINSLAVSHKTHIFASTNEKGIYYSNNNGSTWKKYGLEDYVVNNILDMPHADVVIASSGNMIFRLKLR